MNRFYCADIDGGVLDEAESRHAVQVLRLKDGAKADVFNGKGREAHVELVRSSAKRVEFQIISSTTTPQPPYKLSVAQAVTKGKSMDLILQKLTEIGVQEIHPILSERSVVRIDDDKNSDKTEKWNQTLVEACKQCGLNQIPVLHPPVSPSEFLANAGKSSLKLIASLQPGARSIREIVREHLTTGKALDDVVFMVGPEGDFAPSEIGQALAAGFLPITLGPHVLRSETAAIFTASVLLHEMRNP